jgi:hypothetical protein
VSLTLVNADVDVRRLIPTTSPPSTNYILLDHCAGPPLADEDQRHSLSGIREN